MQGTLAAPSILQAPVFGSTSHIATNAECVWLISSLVARAKLVGCVTPVVDVPVGNVLQFAGLPYGGAQSPWKRLSGVRFSWIARMMCWKEAI